jgi:CRISPR-associated protein Csb2
VPKLSYLGRAESVVEARLVADAELPVGDLATTADVNRPGAEPVSLLAPMTFADYATWLARALPTPERDARKEPKTKKGSPFPPDALAALLVDTAFVQEHGWTQPPGSRCVLYYRSPLRSSPTRVVQRPKNVAPADSALFALASNTRNREVLPLMFRGLPQLELLHRGLLSKLGDVDCPELSGRDARGVRLEGHRHAHFLPLDLDQDGHLDHVLIHAPRGFGEEAQRALRALRVTYSKGLDKPLFVTLVGLGELPEFTGHLGNGLSSILELRQSSTWQSRTPFVPARHIKAKRDTLVDQVQAELAWRELPKAASIEVLDREFIVAHGFHRFVRKRREPERAPPVEHFFGLRLQLERPARGPIAIGYASHYGLGLFVPVE